MDVHPRPEAEDGTEAKATQCHTVRNIQAQSNRTPENTSPERSAPTPAVVSDLTSIGDLRIRSRQLRLPQVPTTSTDGASRARDRKPRAGQPLSSDLMEPDQATTPKKGRERGGSGTREAGLLWEALDFEALGSSQQKGGSTSKAEVQADGIDDCIETCPETQTTEANSNSTKEGKSRPSGDRGGGFGFQGGFSQGP